MRTLAYTIAGLLACVLQAQAEGYSVNTEQLNLRSGPYSDADVVNKLPRGAKVEPTGEKAGLWWKVVTLIGGKSEQGWVNSAFLIGPGAPVGASNGAAANGQTKAPSTPEETAPLQAGPAPVVTPPSTPLPWPTNPAPAKGPSPTPYIGRLYDKPLQIEDTSLKCDEGIVSGGLDRCRARIDVTYNGHPDVDGQFTVECSVTAEVEMKDAYLTDRVTKRGSDTLYVSHGYGRATVDVKVDFYYQVQPIVRVRMRNVDCSYSRF